MNRRRLKPIHPKGNQPRIFTGRTDAEAETPILWPPDAKNWLNGKAPDAGEGLKAGGEGDDREWDDWMASPTQWTWVWVNSGSWWWTGRPGVLRFMGSQELDTTERLNWTELTENISPWPPVLVHICSCWNLGTFNNTCTYFQLLMAVFIKVSGKFITFCFGLFHKSTLYLIVKIFSCQKSLSKYCKIIVI